MRYRTKRRKSGNKNILILMISLLLLMSPAFHDYRDLAETDILSSQSHFEELHPEDMVSGTARHLAFWGIGYRPF